MACNPVIACWRFLCGCFALFAVDLRQPNPELLSQQSRLLFINRPANKQLTLGLMRHISGINFVAAAALIVFDVGEMHVWSQASSDLKFAQFHVCYR